MKPNPLPLFRAVLPDAIVATKRIYCAQYDACLMQIAKQNCVQWTCEKCSAYKVMPKQQWKDDIANFVELAAAVIEGEDFDVEDEKDIDAIEVEPKNRPVATHRVKSPTESPSGIPDNVATLSREERIIVALNLVRQGWPTKRAGKYTNTASTTIRRESKKLGICFNLGKPPGKEAKLRAKTAKALELIEQGQSVVDAATATNTGTGTIINALEKYKASLDTNLYGL